jgi:Diaphanous GTPase-binding Domain/Diaphanous FH3 Domain
MPPKKKSSSSKSKKMPGAEELGKRFGKLMDNLGIKDAKRKAMMALSDENKWQMVQQYSNVESQSASTTPEKYVKMLQGTVTQKELSSLTVDMQSKPVPWLSEFLEKGGIEPLFAQLELVLNKPEKDRTDQRLLVDLVNCCKGLMNATEDAILAVSTTPGATLSLIKSLDYLVRKNQKVVWELLVVLSYVSPECHQRTLDTLRCKYRLVNSKKKTNGLKKIKHALAKGDHSLSYLVMTLSNALINQIHHVRDRQQLRITLGLLPEFLDQLREVEFENLLIQVDVFDASLLEDEEELAHADAYVAGQSPVQQFEELAGHLRGSGTQQV